MTNGLRRDIDKKMIDTFDSVARLTSKIEDMAFDIKEMKATVSDLNTFKWKVIGGATVLSGIVGWVIKKI